MADETARELLDKALKRREEIGREVAALDNLIAVYRRLLSVHTTESDSAVDQPDLYRGLSRREIRAAQIAELMDAARKIIIAERRPMKRGELVKRLTEQGFHIVGGDRNKVFGTNLWRSGKFRTVEGKGYWPKDVTLPK